MMHVSSPVDIASTTRNSSSSPRQHQTSNLTFALQSTTGNEIRHSPSSNTTTLGGKSSGTSRQDSIAPGMSGLTANYGSGAQPISVNGSARNKPRRESAAGSIAGGMSWGGLSVGSWIRDDVMMQGTSPFALHQSPSFHSSSYLPKLEANFMKDFSCCGLTLASLHDLLQHFEEAHAQQMPAPMPPQYLPPSNGASGSEAAISRALEQQQQHQNINSAKQSKSQVQQQSVNPGMSRNTQQQPQFRPSDFRTTQLQSIPVMDTVDDMDLDDMAAGNLDSDFSNNTAEQYVAPAQSNLPPRSRFGQPAASRVPALDLNTNLGGNPMQNFQGLRQSQPSTPVTGGRPAGMYHNNPTVSSVNTPTLSAHPFQQQQFRRTPDSSTPGTPAELDPEFLGDIGNMSMDNNQQFMQHPQQDLSGYGYGNGNELIDLCIDEPAKRLFSPNGAFNSQQTAHSRLGSAQYGPNSDIARRIREQQRKAGLADTVSGLNGEEPKPFRCPVIGCEKAYKNQNGLKYHKSHGHNNQQLHENVDGTFSIVDPTTLSPYPGTLGMEKEKPYKCEVCGKRYKNLNGLKYHKSHSTPCNPELKLNNGMPLNANAMNANVAGAGLPGLGEDLS